MRLAEAVVASTIFVFACNVPPLSAAGLTFPHADATSSAPAVTTEDAARQAFHVLFPAEITYGQQVDVSVQVVRGARASRASQLVLQQWTGAGWTTRSAARVQRSRRVALSFAPRGWQASLLLRVEATGGHRVLWRSGVAQVAVEPHTIFYDSPSLTRADATDVFSDPLQCGCIATPQDKTVCWIYGVGTIDQSISAWNVGAFTGLNPPDPIGQYQYGHDNGRYSSSACQLSGTWAGALLDKNDGPQTATYYGWGLEYFWSGLLYQPWSSQYGSTQLPGGPYFRMQANWDLGRNFLGTSIQYGSICATFYDAGSGRSMWWCAHPWDSRGADAPGEAIQFNGFSNGSDIVDTYFGTATRLVTLHCQSQARGQTNRNARQPDWYAAYLPWSQFHALTTEINTDFGANYSSDPENYYLTGVLAGSEMYAPGTTYGWMASRVGNLIAMDDANPCTA
jgi:hypothetical protein